jgi:SAM-dependent methyltransferase
MTTLELHGIAHELGFWKEFVKTDRFINGWVGKIKTPELNNKVAEFILNNKNNNILDVGSGAVSLLNGLNNDSNLITCDPLGALYELIFDYNMYGILPPLTYPAEELPYENEFDIVHISNALDHAQDPKLSVDKLLKATKIGGHLIIQGFECEGTFENWLGFHQWDLQYKNQGLTLTDKNNNEILLIDNTKHNVIMGESFDIGNNKKWLICIINK